ncbi:hypothetical protein [Brevundimonas sp. GCM10030266]|uniref:hypothetical protein n=1 Tax=Brevundimonas sp. GCM10030266 TaxID=3273386 RepID=UPI00362468F4
MNFRLLHITITPQVVPIAPHIVQKRLSDLGKDWMSYNAFCWVLWTNKSILTVSEMIMADVNPADHVLVVGLNPAEVPNGRLPDWVWGWFNRPRNPVTGEVLTPAIPAPGASNLFESAMIGGLLPPGNS